MPRLSLSFLCAVALAAVALSLVQAQNLPAAPTLSEPMIHPAPIGTHEGH